MGPGWWRTAAEAVAGPAMAEGKAGVSGWSTPARSNLSFQCLERWIAAQRGGRGHDSALGHRPIPRGACWRQQRSPGHAASFGDASTLASLAWRSLLPSMWQLSRHFNGEACEVAAVVGGPRRVSHLLLFNSRPGANHQQKK